jgi:hypothetical protein
LVAAAMNFAVRSPEPDGSAAIPVDGAVLALVDEAFDIPVGGGPRALPGSLAGSLGASIGSAGAAESDGGGAFESDDVSVPDASVEVFVPPAPSPVAAPLVVLFCDEPPIAVGSEIGPDELAGAGGSLLEAGAWTVSSCAAVAAGDAIVVVAVAPVVLPPAAD